MAGYGNLENSVVTLGCEGGTGQHIMQKAVHIKYIYFLYGRGDSNINIKHIMCRIKKN